MAGWDRIRNDALEVVLSIQRPTGLWALPTCDWELKHLIFAQAGKADVEYEKRRNEPFGHESITVTWKIFEALYAALAEVPPDIRDSVTLRLSQFRSQDGAYGRPLPGNRAERAINESGRHSAAALLLVGVIRDSAPAQLLAEQMSETAKWLCRTVMDGGGWAYNWRLPDSKAEDLSTAYATAALSLLDRQKTGGAPVTNDIASAVRSSFDRLDDLRENKRAWPTVHPEHTSVRDSAGMVEALYLAVQEGALRDVCPRATQQLQTWTADLVAVQREGAAWPAHESQKKISPTATIAMLRLIDVDRSVSGEDRFQEVRLRTERAVLSMYKRRSFHEDVDAWGWAVLLQVAASRSKRIDPDKEMQIRKRVNKRWMEAERNILARSSVDGLQRNAQQAILYALSRGNPSEVPDNHIEAKYRRLPGWMRRGAIPLAIFLAGLALQVAIGCGWLTWMADLVSGGSGSAPSPN